MSSGSERPTVAAVVCRALLYAAAIALLVIYGPGADYAFIYQGF